MNTYFHPETENYKYWTQQEEEKLKGMVVTGKYSFAEIGKVLNRSGQSCQDHSRIMGLDNNYIWRKYFVNDGFWSKPNLLNCYWAGFSAADAYVQIKNNKTYTYRLEIQESDKEHLASLIDSADFTGGISTYRRVKIDKNGRTFNSNTVCIHITSSQWGQDLHSIFNIYPNKTKRLTPPNIHNNYLLFSWLIGYICGDGTIFYNKLNNQLNLKFISSSEAIIVWIKSFLDNNFNDCKLRNTKSSVKESKNGNYFNYCIGGVQACVIVDYLSQFPVPKLARKWSNPLVLDYISKQKEKYPHLFKTLNQEEIKNLLPKSENSISQLVPISV